MQWTPQSTPTKYGTRLVACWQEISISGSRNISVTAIAHHFRKICRNPLTRSEPRAPQQIEVRAKVTFVIGLVKGDGKELERAVVIGFVPGLQRIDEDQRAAGPQHPPDLGYGRAADARRQFVKQINAGDDVEFGVGKGHRLGHALDKPGTRPRRELAPGNGQVIWRQIETGDMEARVIRLYLPEKSPGSAGDVEQPCASPDGRGRIVAGLDVAPVLLHQRAQIREETLPVRHWTLAERFRQSHRTTHSGSQQFLTEEPADTCGLRRVERHPVQSGYHSERGVNAEVPLCKGTERAMLPRIRVLILSTVERRHRSTEMPLGDHCRSLAGNCEDGHGWSASPAAGRRDVGR